MRILNLQEKFQGFVVLFLLLKIKQVEIDGIILTNLGGKGYAYNFFNINGIYVTWSLLCASEFLFSSKFYLFPLQILCPGEISQAYDISMQYLARASLLTLATQTLRMTVTSAT